MSTYRSHDCRLPVKLRAKGLSVKGRPDDRCCRRDGSRARLARLRVVLALIGEQGEGQCVPNPLQRDQRSMTREGHCR